MKQSVYAHYSPCGAQSAPRARAKAGSGKLLDGFLGLCAEVGVALAITAIGFILSLLCGW